MVSRRRRLGRPSDGTVKGRNEIPEGFNTGALIYRAMRQTRVTQTEMARRTGRTPSTVREVRLRRSTQASILHEFSIAMGVDLFRPLSDNLPEHIRSNPEKTTIDVLMADKETLQLQVSELKAQLSQLREDNGYLKKMIDILAAK